MLFKYIIRHAIEQLNNSCGIKHGSGSMKSIKEKRKTFTFFLLIIYDIPTRFSF